MKEAAQIAHEAHAAHTARPGPEWQNLPERERDAWRMAFGAVRLHFEPASLPSPLALLCDAYRADLETEARYNHWTEAERKMLDLALKWFNRHAAHAEGRPPGGLG